MSENARKLKLQHLNPSTSIVQHVEIGTVGLLAVGTKAQPDALVFHPLHALWSADTLRELAGLMGEVVVTHPAMPEFKLAVSDEDGAQQGVRPADGKAEVDD